MIFFNKKNCPIDENARIWIENSLIWLIKQLSEDILLKKNIVQPNDEIFQGFFEGNEQYVNKILPFICSQMDIDSNLIKIEFFKENNTELNNGIGNSIFTQLKDGENFNTGLYLGRDKEGKFLIALERKLLSDPANLISTIAHELAHVKIEGENRLKNADERLIDLVTVFYGLGIFNANSSANFYKSSEKWGYFKKGYLTQQEWGYSLALYAYIRNEKLPNWLNFLSINIKSDFLKSQNFIYSNTNKVLI